jgi:hypothetical protein
MPEQRKYTRQEADKTLKCFAKDGMVKKRSPFLQPAKCRIQAKPLVVDLKQLIIALTEGLKLDHASQIIHFCFSIQSYFVLVLLLFQPFQS